MGTKKRGLHNKDRANMNFFKSKLVLDSFKSKITFFVVVFLFGVVIVLAWMDVYDSWGDEGNLRDGFGNLGQNENVFLSSEENLINLEGEYGTTIIDNFEDNKYDFFDFISVDGRLTYLNFLDLPSGIKYGENIKIQGYYDNAATGEAKFNVVNTESLGQVGITAGELNNNPVIGEQKTAVVLLVYDGQGYYRPYTKEEVYNFIYNLSNKNSISSYFNKTSYGKTWLSGGIDDIYGYYELPYFPLISLSDTLPLNGFIDTYVDNEINFSKNNYRRIITIWLRNESYENVGGIAITGFGLIPTHTDEGIKQMSVSYIYLTGFDNINSNKVKGVIEHELGHNFGARHSGSYNCYPDLRDYCSFFAYGDEYDPMGTSRGENANNHFNSIPKETLGWADTTENLGWFNSGNIIEVSEELENFGQYRLYPLEFPSRNIQAIKIPSFDYKFDGEGHTISETRDYYIEFRNNTYENYGNGEYPLEPFVMRRLKAIDIESSDPEFYFYNIIGSGNSLFLDDFSLLSQGDSFVDEKSNVKIKVDEINNDSSLVSINRAFQCVDLDDENYPPGRSIPSNRSFKVGSKYGSTLSFGEKKYDYCDPLNQDYIFESYCNVNGDSSYYHTKCPGISECFNEISYGDYCNCYPDIISVINSTFIENDLEISQLRSINNFLIRGNYTFIIDDWNNVFSIINISDPYNLKGISQLNNSDSAMNYMIQPRSISLYGDNIFIGSEYNGGISVVDISDLDNPRGKSPIILESNEDFYFPIEVFTYKDLLIATGPNKMFIFNITNDSNILSSTTINDTEPAGWQITPQSIFVKDDIAYLITYDKLLIINISEPHHPKIVKKLEYLFNGARDIVIKDNLAFVVSFDEGLLIINVTNPYSPEFNQFNGDSEYHLYGSNSIFIKDNSAYLYTGYEISVVDISDPYKPMILIQFFDNLNQNGRNNLIVKDSMIFISNHKSLILADLTNFYNCNKEPVCGNNIIEGQEECDDGNIDNGDGCSSTCEIETQTQCSSGADTDGNGNIDKDELDNYIQEYYIGNVNIDKLSNAITEHLNGCG